MGGKTVGSKSLFKYVLNKLYNIPFFQDTARGFDYAKAGIGKFAGIYRFKDFLKDKIYETDSQTIYGKLAYDIERQQHRVEVGGQVFYGEVVPDPKRHRGTIKTPFRGYDPAERPIFEVRTHGGSRKTYVVFDGKPYDSFLKAAERAKKEGRSDELDGAEARYEQTPGRLRGMSIEQLKKIYKTVPELNDAKKLTPKVLDAVIKRQQEMDMRKIRTAKNNIEMLKRFDINDFPMIDPKKGNWRKKQSDLDPETYRNWESADPNVDKPWFTSLYYYGRDSKGNEIRKPAIEPTEDGRPKRFSSKEEAQAWADKNWKQSDGLLQQISEIDAKLDFYEGTTHSQWVQSKNNVSKNRKMADISKTDAKNMLNSLFPHAKGSLENLNLHEMKSFERTLDPAPEFKQYHENMSEITAPTRADNLKLGMRKFWNGLRKLTLPVYTVLGWHRGAAGLELADRALKTDLFRFEVAGEYTRWKKDIRKEHNLSESQFRKLSALFDEGKFGSFYDKSLDKLDKIALKESYESFTDNIMNIMIHSGMMIKNGKTGNWERIFDAYDSKGHEIKPNVAQDVLRIVKGYEYLDNTGARKISENDTVYNKSHGVRLPTDDYVRKSLIPDYDNVWVIRGKNRYVATDAGKKGIKWRKLGVNEIDVVQTWGEVKRGETIHNVEIYKKSSKGKLTRAKGKPNHHVVTSYVPRVVTPEFKKLLGLDTEFLSRMARSLAKTNPEYRGMSVSEAELLAMTDIQRQSSYWDETGLFGTQWSRIAELPPVIAFERHIVDGKKIDTIIDMEGNSVLDSDGKVMSKGSEVVDINGNTKTVSKTVDVYERDLDSALARYITKVAHQTAVHMHFPMDSTETQAGIKSNVASELIGRLAAETNEDFAGWAREALKMQLNGSRHVLFEEGVRKWTAISSHIGLSSPMSGIKNIILGQVSNINTFGLRATMNTWRQLLAGGFGDAKTLAEKLGQTEAGVHELYSGRGPFRRSWQVLNPGLMRPTELFNRYTGVVLGRTALEMHVKNLKGIKDVSNIGFSQRSSMNVLREAFKFTREEIKKLLEFTPEEVMNETNPKTEFFRTRAMQQGSLFTQGGPSLPMIPKWMGHRMAKPMTLFYRIAYRVTDSIAKMVMKPAIVDGNPFPLLRYVALGTGSGAAIYSMYYYALGEDRMNRFKKAPFAYWDMFIRGEGLGVMSNAFDDMGNVSDTYSPVIWRNAKSTKDATISILTGQKKFGQATADWFKENVVIVNHTMEALQRGNRAIDNRVQHSKRRQRQFGEEYLGKEAYQGDVEDRLTTRSPYYRMVREAFWSDDPRAKAKAHYAALQFVGHDFFRKAPELLNDPKRTEKKTINILKSIVNKQRPMPSSWWKRQFGKKSRRELYFEKLDAETIQEEQDLDREFKIKLQEWNAAINRYRKQYYRSILGEVA